MSRITRLAAMAAGATAVSAALLTATTANAQATEAPPANAHAAVVKPAGEVCGFNSGGVFGQAQYLNCSPFSVQIRIEWQWWQFRDDTFMCIGPHMSNALNNDGDIAPAFAVFDGVTNC